MVSDPNTIRNADTDALSKTTWASCTTNNTRIRFHRSKPLTSACAAGSASGSATSSPAGILERRAPAGPHQQRLVDVVVGAVHLLGQPDQQERNRDQPEKHHDQPERADGDGGTDLPHLGIDEQKRDREQQQRQRAGGVRQHLSQAAQGASQSPAHDRPCVQRGERVPEQGQAAQCNQHRRRGTELPRHPGDHSTCASRQQGGDEHQRHGPLQPERVAYVGSLLGHEVRQAVLDEPLLSGGQRSLVRHRAGAWSLRRRR